MCKRLFVCLLFCLPLNAFAAVVFEFDSVCTDAIRNTDCVYFGLTGTDPVTGMLTVDPQLGTPGEISWLTADQYLFTFSFGNQSFTEQDATQDLGFLVGLDGASISSLLGNYQNANGAQLTLLTTTTANVSLDGFEADTYAGGGSWMLADGSDVFTGPVPLPASNGLFLSAMGVLGFLMRSSKRSRIALQNER